MLIAVILWSTLLASTPHALPAPDAGPRAATHSARDLDLHERVSKLLVSNDLRLMLFQPTSGSPEFVAYATIVHPLVPIEIAAHFAEDLAKLENKFAKDYDIDVREIRREVDTVILLAQFNLRHLDVAGVNRVIDFHKPTLGARFAEAFVESVRVMDTPLVNGGHPALSEKFFGNLSQHLDRAIARTRELSSDARTPKVAAWLDRELPKSIAVPVTLAKVPVPHPVAAPGAETFGLLRQALNLDACSNAFGLTEDEASAESAADVGPAPSPDVVTPDVSPPEGLHPEVLGPATEPPIVPKIVD